MKTKILKYLAFSILFFSFKITTLFSQNEKHCGTTEAIRVLRNTYPELVQKEIDYQNSLTQEIAKQKLQKSVQGTDYVYIIPVVFHVIHTYGTENISDAQIQDQVNILNRDYRKRNADTAAIKHGFDSIAADISIEFRLAHIDPNGNCTNGIDRIYSHKTNNADDDSKLNQWPRDKYLNVWTVKTIGSAGVAGYAYYPSDVNGFLAKYDGIIILSDYIGSIGTGSAYTSRALTHEIGHYLSLQHPWGSTNSPEVACGDDGVNDTPETMGHLSCKINDSTCNAGVYENVQNYMDYSYCSVMFTKGQKDRMRVAKASDVSDRNHLSWTSNLVATGTDGSTTQTCIPYPDFSSNTNSICAGGSVLFKKNILKATATNILWTFEGGNPATSSSSTPSVIYNTAGDYKVKLTASNATGTDSLTKNYFIHVNSTTAQYSGLATENFENTSSFYSNWIINNYDNNTNKWNFSNSVGYNSNHSIAMSGYQNYAYDVDDFITPSFDLSGLTNSAFTFRCAAASTATSLADINDVLKIYSSTNCGQTWALRSTLQGAALLNAGYRSQNFVPNSTDQWVLQSIAIPNSIATSNVRFKFEYTSGNASNNIYVDDINIVNTTGIAENAMDENNITIYPNPTNQTATIYYHLTKKSNVTIQISDVVGKKIMENIGNQTEGDYAFQLSKQVYNLNNGIYFIRLSINDKTITKKLIVTE